MAIISQSDRQYGNPSWIEKAAVVLSAFLHMPIVVAWTLLSSPFNPSNRSKTWKRVIGDKIFYHLTTQFNTKQLQWVMGNTGTVHKSWTMQNGLPFEVDELGEDARLFWIGKRRTDRVILYFHGGAFLFPLQDFATSFWSYIQKELKKKNIDTGVAILDYTLLPSATFPTQLRQAVAAIEHLMSTGVAPQNIQIAGDSAGANLALQLMSHILHPLQGIRPLNLPSRIKGVYLMSPWIATIGQEGSMTSNDGKDVVTCKSTNYWGQQFLDGVPHSQLSYVAASRAPASWFGAIDTTVERVLITVGSAECMRDSIEEFAMHICNIHEGAMFWMQENGVHNDPYFDFFIRGAKLGKMTTEILEWFATGFNEV